jgi:hypothetical protein
MLKEQAEYYDLVQRLDDAFIEIDSDMCVYLRQNDDDYIALYHEHRDLTNKFSFIEDMTNGTVPASLGTDEISALTRCIALKYAMNCAELKAMYYRGHTDCIAYLRKIEAF